MNTLRMMGPYPSNDNTGFFKRAEFGVDPFQSLMSGLETVIPIGFGTLYVLVNTILVLFVFFTDKTKIGLATFLNVFLLGYIVDLSQWMLQYFFPILQYSGRIICLIIGVVFMCLASAFYFTADLGVSPYDAIALILTQKWNIASFRKVRIISDFCCICMGILLFTLSGNNFSEIKSLIGIGTVLTAFFMGPLIEFFSVQVAQNYLKKHK